MLPLTNGAVPFEKLKLGFSGNLKKCVSFFPSPLSYHAYPEGFGNPFTFIYIALTFPTEIFHFSEIPDKYLLKSVSR